MPPRLAAIACSTTTRTIRSRHPAASSDRIAIGVNVISATSLVTSIDAKKGSITSASATNRCERSPATRAFAARSMTPLSRMPATAAMRQNSSAITRQSM